MSALDKRELSAEFLGTLVLMVFGLGVNAQVSLGAEDFGNFFSVNVGWGLAVVMGIYVSGGISGAHLNPAVTLALAARGRFAWSKVVPFIVVQLIAALLASLLVYLVYREAINFAEHQAAGAEAAAVEEASRTMETAGIWGTYPREFDEQHRVSTMTGLIDQIVGTALLLLCIFGLSDKKNISPESNLAPLLVGCIVFLIGMTFGSNCGYAINPVRDFGPRLFSFVAGWGSQVFTKPDSIWWLVPIVGPCIGGVIGGLVYDACVTRFHGESTDGDSE